MQNASYEHDAEGALVMRDRIEANWSGTPWHIHPLQTEQFEILEGALWVETRDGCLQVSKGECYTVARGQPHRVHTIGEAQVEAIITLDPAYDSDVYFRGVALCFKQHRNTLLQVALMQSEVDHLGFYYAGIPIWFQDMLFALLAPLARLLGYRMPESN
ncbi:cupin domain-containing protein [uncultured Cohaesibacter sp.]|uniref:cupin domain-containing protein n=1 Tax=uncultured Cohaesibacter sp. TaxID=1002546 RepID=UPI0029C97CB1|nr:cupin domain-containing protein [uncultured Cohaesibacter sp.]